MFEGGIIKIKYRLTVLFKIFTPSVTLNTLTMYKYIEYFEKNWVKSGGHFGIQDSNFQTLSTIMPLDS